ncbi:hypothetical protein [Ktedonobacter sp. SOSP1-52]|uniref:hypothetical protein n=1 Tax=Ktedonobacter sp. SOSP1-52 TaxID=2778366 RepID=UPI001915C117|nr:hypothetical protein [Ktedonobacter sp. SOSP1-52]
MSEFQKGHSLHDGPINNLQFFPEQGKLILEVDICDDGQWPFLKNSIDPFPIKFVFTGVSHYSISTGSLDFENDEINDMRMLSSANPEKETLEFLLLITPNQGVKLLQIEAENVDWDIS